MSYGEILFQGTWGEALDHAADIPCDRPVRIVSVENAPQPGFQERHRALVDEIIAKADALPDYTTSHDARYDPYRRILTEKFRQQGLDLE